MKETSITITTGGDSQAVAISTTSAQSAVIAADSATLYATTDCFVRRGSNPTAVADGTDQFVPANTLLRINGLTNDNLSKLAFKTATGTGTVYITPGV